MKSLPVQCFVFQFPDHWPIAKYDDSHFYLSRLKHVQGTKAVDVLAVKNNVIFIIEATDLRGHRVQNKKHMQDGGLALETAQKVRDTIAVLYGAYRNEDYALRAFCDFLYAHSDRPMINVVLLLEEDRPPTVHKSFKKIRSDLLLSIKQKLKYLKVRCMVYSCNEVPPEFGWTVRTVRRREGET